MKNNNEKKILETAQELSSRIDKMLEIVDKIYKLESETRFFDQYRNEILSTDNNIKEISGNIHNNYLEAIEKMLAHKQEILTWVEKSDYLINKILESDNSSQKFISVINTIIKKIDIDIQMYNNEIEFENIYNIESLPVPEETKQLYRDYLNLLKSLRESQLNYRDKISSIIKLKKPTSNDSCLDNKTKSHELPHKH